MKSHPFAIACTLLLLCGSCAAVRAQATTQISIEFASETSASVGLSQVAPNGDESNYSHIEMGRNHTQFGHKTFLRGVAMYRRLSLELIGLLVDRNPVTY